MSWTSNACSWPGCVRTARKRLPFCKDHLRRLRGMDWHRLLLIAHLPGVPEGERSATLYVYATALVNTYVSRPRTRRERFVVHVLN